MNPDDADPKRAQDENDQLSTWIDGERETRLAAIDEEIPSYTSVPKPSEKPAA